MFQPLAFIEFWLRNGRRSRLFFQRILDFVLENALLFCLVDYVCRVFFRNIKISGYLIRNIYRAEIVSLGFAAER